MNSVVSRALVGNGINYDQSKTSEVKKLPREFLFQESGTQPNLTYQHKIKWKNSSCNYDNLNKKGRLPIPSDSSSKKFVSKRDSSEANLNTSQHKDVSRSNSNEKGHLNRTQNESNLENSRSSLHSIDLKNKSLNNTSLMETKRSKIGRIESTESIIGIHKFFKEKNIYSDPNDNYKRRTIVLIKNSSNSSGTGHRNSFIDSPGNNSDFGFHLQSYGLVNTTTKLTEFICFVDNVQPGSPAKHAGLNNGDVLLALDGIPINEFTNLQEIIKHVKGKNELRLVVMCENVCKKIQLQQRLESIKAKLNSKKEQLERLNKQQEAILNKKDTFNSFTSPLSSSTSSSMTNSSISESHLYPTSPLFSQGTDMNLLSPELVLNSSMMLKNSTPYDTKNAFILSPDLIFNENLRASSDHENQTEYNVAQNSNGARASNYSSLNETTNAKRLNSKSSSSPNGTARIQVDLNLDLTSPIIPTSSSSYSTYSSASSTNSTSSSATTNASSASTLNKTRQLAHKYIQQTSKIVRSASSSSMSLISKLNRSSRSRNSSTCSTNLNNTIDVSDSKKISAKLDKSISSDTISKANNDYKMTSTNILADSTNSSSKLKLAKTSSLTNDKSSFSSTSSRKQQSPRMVKPPSVRGDFYQQAHPHRHSMLSKFHNTHIQNLENSDSREMTDTSSVKNAVYRFSALQNKPIKKERFKSVQPIISIQSEEFPSHIEPLFSPVQANQSSLLNEIIDSGIDVGIGLAVSPNYSGSSSYSEGQRVAKVMSDGGYSSFLNDFSIKEITYIDEKRSVKKESVIENNINNKGQINHTTKLHDDCFITKL